LIQMAGVRSNKPSGIFQSRFQLTQKPMGSQVPDLQSSRQVFDRRPLMRGNLYGVDFERGRKFRVAQLCPGVLERPSRSLQQRS
jgi:hypothetical protein